MRAHDIKGGSVNAVCLLKIISSLVLRGTNSFCLHKSGPLNQSLRSFSSQTGTYCIYKRFLFGALPHLISFGHFVDFYTGAVNQINLNVWQFDKI